MQKQFFALALLLNTVFAFAQAPENNLEAHFDFESIADNSLVDVTNKGSSGIFLGDTVTQGCGISGKSVRLDGSTNAIVFFGRINDQFKGGDFTISLYFKPETTGGQAQALFCKADACDADHFLGVRLSAISRYVEATIRENRTNKKTLIKGNYNKACWHHLVLVKTKDDITLYLDGKLSNRVPISSAYSLTSTAPFTIAEHQCRGSNLVRFKGELDEMYVYSRKFLPSEIKLLYTPVDKILTRDTVVYINNSSFQAQTTRTCANKFKWMPEDGVSDPLSRTPIITPTETTIYALKFTDEASGCSTTDSVLIKVIDPALVGCTQVLLPNAFTPNGDNLNEIFYISNPYAIEKLVSFEVFNRWGARVFTTDDKFTGWSGEIGGKISTTDTFVYKVEYECGGKRENLSGTFTLMR